MNKPKLLLDKFLRHPTASSLREFQNSLIRTLCLNEQLGVKYQYCDECPISWQVEPIESLKPRYSGSQCNALCSRAGYIRTETFLPIILGGLFRYKAYLELLEDEGRVVRSIDD
jgi:hypothetical protein